MFIRRAHVSRLRCACQAAHSCPFYTKTNHSCPFLTMMNHSCPFSTTMNLVQQVDLEQWLICFADLADIHIMSAALPSNISGRLAALGRSNSAKRIRAARPELAKRSASAQRTRVEPACEGDNEPKVSWLAVSLSCLAFAICEIDLFARLVLLRGVCTVCCAIFAYSVHKL